MRNLLYRMGIAGNTGGPHVGQDLEPETPESTWSDWIWPLPVFHGVPPVISDHYQAEKTDDHRQHFGLDMAHKIPANAAKGLEFPKITREFGRKGNRKVFAIFNHEGAYLPGPGKVFSAKNTTTGYTVKTSHRVRQNDGTVVPILSVVRHIRDGTQNPQLIKGAVLPAGTRLGDVGDNPSSHDPEHVHFELWDTRLGGNRESAAFNPADVMKPWRALFVPGEVIGEFPFPPRLPRDPSAKSRAPGQPTQTGKVTITLVMLLIGVAALARLLLGKVFLV